MGKSLLPAERSGKVKIGQTVNVSFDNFPNNEFGIVKGVIKNISLVPSEIEKKKIYIKYMDKSKISMITKIDDFGNKILGIEDYIPNAQYQTEEHTNAVVEDIINGWDIISQNSKFHAIFATSSIPEAINYYKLFKSKTSKLKVTCLFDEHIDNIEGYKVKEEGVLEIIKDYNNLYKQEFNIASFPKMKKDIFYALRNDNFTYPVCLDLGNKFYNANKIPDDMMLQTFLLDKDNKIIALGNPIHNSKIKDLFLNIISGGTGKTMHKHLSGCPTVRVMFPIWMMCTLVETD